MPIQAIQMEIVPGQPEKNLTRALSLVEKAGNVDPQGLLLFPEMTIPGYFIGDRWRDRTYMQECHAMTDELVAKTRGGLGIIFGNVTPDFENRGEDGLFRRYNSAIVAHDGKLVTNAASAHLGAGRTHKSLMPNYDKFHDKRYFTSLTKLARDLNVTLPDILRAFDIPIDGQMTRVGVMICEDMWDHAYADKPTDILKKDGAEILVNLSSSPFGIDKARVRDAYLARQSKDVKQFWYVNNIGRGGNGKNEHAFDGASLLFENGEKTMQAPTFTEGSFDATNDITEAPNKMKEIFDALIYTIRTRWESLGRKKMVIGLSGGIDSAVSAALHRLAIGAENVIGVNMPNEYNGALLKGAAQKLAENLGITYLVSPIQETVALEVRHIIDATGREPTAFHRENIQARNRGIRQMGLAPVFEDGLYVGNANKSEVFTGYGTLHADISGYMFPLADLYKTQVRSLAYFINATYGELIPVTTLDVPASAELSPDQGVGMQRNNESPFRGEGGDPFVYPYHDALFYQIWDMDTAPAEILRDYADGTLAAKLHKNYDVLVDATVTPASEIVRAHENIDALMQADPRLFIEDLERVYKLLCNNYFKRVQCPTIVSLSRRAFGYNNHEAENGAYFGRVYARIKKEILGIKVSIDDVHIQGLIRTRGVATPRKQPMFARLPKAEEIGQELITYVSRDGQLEIESRHMMTADMVLCSNGGVIGTLDGRDLYNEWPRSREYFDIHYGGTLSDRMQPFQERTVATIVPANDIWKELGGKDDQQSVVVAVPWGAGTMVVYRDGYVSSEGNGIAREEYLKTYI